MPRWVKLSERIGQDGRLGELAEADPMAALLFTWSIAAADIYGILPARPRDYLARVAPSIRLTDERVAEIIEAQASAGLITVYERDGRRAVYLHSYHKHQTVRWDKRVGSPEYALPENWRIPDKLREVLERSGSGPGPTHFGLCATPTGLCVEVPDQSRTSPGVVPLRLDTDTDVDTDDKQPRSSAPSPLRTGPSLEQQLAQHLDGLDPEDVALIEEYMDNAARQNKSGKITMQRRVDETLELAQLRARFGAEAWQHGMRAANKAGVPNTTYVQRCAENWTPTRERASPPPQRKYFPPEEIRGPTRVGGMREIIAAVEEAQQKHARETEQQ